MEGGLRAEGGGGDGDGDIDFRIVLYVQNRTVQHTTRLGSRLHPRDTGHMVCPPDPRRDNPVMPS
jgi:hypothetical protein